MPEMPKKIHITPQDFSNRDYFPGTADHPFHAINTAFHLLNRFPPFLFPIIFGLISYFFTSSPTKAIIFLIVGAMDLVLLSSLKRFRISFGPPSLTWIALNLARLIGLTFPFPFFLLFQILGTLLVIYGFYIEPQVPKLSRYSVDLSRSEAAVTTLRVVHISDLHMEYLTQREARAVKMINQLEPDLILFSGDFFNLSYQEDPQTFNDIQTFFAKLNAKQGIFGVTGSPAVDIDEAIQAIEGKLALKLINDQVVTIEKNHTAIKLIGLYCSHQPDPDYERLKSLLPEASGFPTLLLYHSPDISPLLKKDEIDLQLSGHTHGGQVCLPFIGPLFTSSLYGLKFSSGHYLVNKHTHLIISRGIGLEGEDAPRVRFLSPPEISLITLDIPRNAVK